MTLETFYPTHRSGFSVVLTLAISLGLWAHATSAWASDSRFVPSARGEEVTDTQTGLIWRRCSEGQTWVGGTCSGSHTDYTWDNALVHAKSTAISTGVAWRLPNVKELQTLIQRYGMVNPAVDRSAFPNTPSKSFWTSTPNASNASHAWVVRFGYGYVNSYGHDNRSAVRLVRDAQ